MGKYGDIIDLPHHVSNVHPQMPLEERAAQFSPFAALAGHGDAIRETARFTDALVELDEDRRDNCFHGIYYTDGVRIVLGRGVRYSACPLGINL